MQFSDIQNKVIEPKVIELLGEKIEVKQYLPMQDKMNILEMVIQTADAGTILNTLVLDAVFEMYLIFKYTNIEFTEEEKNNILETYDKLEINDMIIPIISNIPETEYKLLRDNLLVMIDDYKSYSEFKQDCSVAATSANVIDNIVIKFNKIITTIDRIIVKLSTAIKSVESEDPQLNKVNYVDILNFECYSTFSEEQNKLIREGKDIFSKEMLSIDIKMLRTFKSRVLRIFNKYFGKDSYFGPLNKQDACR